MSTDADEPQEARPEGGARQRRIEAVGTVTAHDDTGTAAWQQDVHAGGDVRAIVANPAAAVAAGASAVPAPTVGVSLVNVVAGRDVHATYQVNLYAASAPDASMPSASAVPVPIYRNAAVRALSERLENARARRAALCGAELATQELDREILDLRRQLREGGQLLAGDSVGDGRYLLVKTAGRGGFAVVWEAYDRSIAQIVAVKVLHSHLAGDPLRRARFFRGARAMMKLAGSAVVRILEPEAEDGGFYYFVMEFLSGGNLSDAVLKRTLQAERMFAIILRVCEVMAAAHAMGIIHRDIKPSNILLDGDGNPELADFDLVALPDTTGGTRTGALGSLLYAAPECLDRPQESTAQADVYGLGMTAIFCLSGQELTRSIFRNPERSISMLGCSERVKAVLQRAVAWEPSERFVDAAALLNALQAALSTHVVVQTPSGGRIEEVPSSYRLRSSRIPLIVAGLLVAIAVISLLYVMQTTGVEGSNTAKSPISLEAAEPPDAPLPIDAPSGPTRDDIVALAHYGFFSIMANARTQIYIDNNNIGETPLTRLPLAPGPHKVKAIGPRGKVKTLNINIYGGQDTDEGTINW